MQQIGMKWLTASRHTEVSINYAFKNVRGAQCIELRSIAVTFTHIQSVNVFDLEIKKKKGQPYYTQCMQILHYDALDFRFSLLSYPHLIYIF